MHYKERRCDSLKRLKRRSKEKWRSKAGNENVLQEGTVRMCKSLTFVLFFVKGESPIFVIVLLADIWGGPSLELL